MDERLSHRVVPPPNGLLFRGSVSGNAPSALMEYYWSSVNRPLWRPVWGKSEISPLTACTDTFCILYGFIFISFLSLALALWISIAVHTVH